MDLMPFEPPDYDNYDDGAPQGSYAPPDPGRYTGKVPLITDEAFGKTQEGYLSVLVDPIEILGNGGHTVRFTYLSAKKYKNREASQVTDFLRSCGIAARPKTNEEVKAAVKQASGRTFQFGLDWEARNKTTGEKVKGKANFPQDPADPNKKLPYILDTVDANKRWWANGRIRYFINAIGG